LMFGRVKKELRVRREVERRHGQSVIWQIHARVVAKCGAKSRKKLFTLTPRPRRSFLFVVAELNECY
jgi:hypothetical protein